jgi:hypothetical protein
MPRFGVFSASHTGALAYVSQDGQVYGPLTVLSNSIGLKP